MKPVHQTVFGQRGNCMAACFASIFELSLDEVPNFYDAGPDDSDWHNAVRDWLRPRGFALISVSFGEALSPMRLAGWQIVWGPSPRLADTLHATVWHRGRMVHDPHPDGTGVIKAEGVDLLYCIDPSVMRVQELVREGVAA